MNATLTESGLSTGMKTDAAAHLATDETFEAVFDRNWQPLFRLATMMTGNRSEGEELAQEAIMRWYVRRGSLKGPDHNPDAYLRTVLMNLCRGTFRRRATVARNAHFFSGAEAVVSTQDPLIDVIRKLPVRQRAAIVLRFYDGRDDNEIARILECRPATVRSLLSRAMATLRTEVER
jgi:RNA polymerase sigma factor (sigma-70 family)